MPRFYGDKISHKLNNFWDIDTCSWQFVCESFEDEVLIAPARNILSLCQSYGSFGGFERKELQEYLCSPGLDYSYSKRMVDGGFLRLKLLDNEEVFFVTAKLLKNQKVKRRPSWERRG